MLHIWQVQNKKDTKTGIKKAWHVNMKQFSHGLFQLIAPGPLRSVPPASRWYPTEFFQDSLIFGRARTTEDKGLSPTNLHVTI